MVSLVIFAGLLAAPPNMAEASSSRPVPLQIDSARALEGYVTRKDSAFGWQVRREGEIAGTPFTELLLTSQTWRGIPWRHQLFVIWPDAMPEDAGHALLFIHSGRWSEALDDLGHEPELPRQAAYFALVAELLGTPFVVLRQVPFQPLFDGLTEDDLIAYTFERYLESGEPDWPLLLPMVKSAVRAMDAVQEHARQSRGLVLDTFTVAGASKRGWTTWLTGAVDPRVWGIVPMVIDVLNMQEHLDLQISVWGKHSRQIAPYTERGLHEKLNTEAGQALLTKIDPYRYRARLELPKLIIIGTNDAYWPLDALELYWDELPGPKWILYLPNQGHGAEDYPRVVGSLIHFHRHLAEGTALPEPGWRFEQDEGAEGSPRLRVWSDVEPESIELWSARSASRDFRDAEWTSRSCKADGGQFVCELERPETGYAAAFAELTYAGWHGELPLRFSTRVRIFAASGSS